MPYPEHFEIKHPEVKAQHDAIRAERAQAKLDRDALWEDIKAGHDIIKEHQPGANTIPAFAGGKIKTVDMGGAQYDPATIERHLKRAKKAGFDGVSFENLYDWGGGVGTKSRPQTTTAIFDPANIRSKFAAFDPAKRGSANLLAGIGAGAMLAPSMFGNRGGER